VKEPKPKVQAHVSIHRVMCMSERYKASLLVDCGPDVRWAVEGEGATEAEAVAAMFIFLWSLHTPEGCSRVASRAGLVVEHKPKPPAKKKAPEPKKIDPLRKRGWVRMEDRK